MQTNTSLTHKLEQYSNTDRGQNTRAKSATEWAGYAAAAGASLAMAGTADATIIYSGVQNITAQINPAATPVTSSSGVFASASGFSFNMGASVLSATVAFFGSTLAGNAAKYSGGGVIQGAAFLGASGSANSGLLGASFLEASHADIGPGGNFSTNAAGRVRYNTVSAIGTGSTYNLTFGNFPLGVTGIAGVQLASGNYGWIRLKLEDLGLNQPFATLLGAPLGDGQNYADKITVIDWAYEDNGAPIHAGDNGQTVPEPSALALLAAGAAGIGAFRRRKAEQASH